LSHGVALELAQNRLGRHRVDEPHVRSDVLHLAALQRADEVPGEVAAVALVLGHEILGAVLAEQGDACLGQRGQLVGRHVLGGCQQLDLARVAPRAGDLLADAVEVLADVLRPQSSELARHVRQMMPAWRPVTPLSRRWEKNRSSRQLVQIPTLLIWVTPPASSFVRAIVRSESMRASAASGMPAKASSTSGPTS